MNPSNKTAKRPKPTTTAKNIEQADIALREPVGFRHYQQITNQGDFHQRGHQVHNTITDDCSTDGSSSGYVNQVECHHYRLNTIEDDNQLPHDTPQEVDGESYCCGENDSDSSNSFENNNEQDLASIDCQVLDLSNQLSCRGVQSSDLTVSGCNHSPLPPVSNLVSPSMLLTQVNTEPGNGGKLATSCMGEDCSVTARKVVPEILLLNGKQYKIIHLGGGFWISKNKFERL